MTFGLQMYTESHAFWVSPNTGTGPECALVERFTDSYWMVSDICVLSVALSSAPHHQSCSTLPDWMTDGE